MALENLSEEIEKEKLAQRKRYPLMEIVNDMEIIRTLSEKTLAYTGEMYPALKSLDIWEVVPRFTMEFLRQYFILADSKKSKDNIVLLHVGDFLELGVEFGSTPGADKEGTFNPIIKLGPELLYDNNNPKNNHLKKEPPVIPVEDEEQIMTICQKANNVLKTKYGLIIQDPNNIWQITFNFLRQIKNWLVENRDQDDFVDIDLGNILDVGISKTDKHDLSFYDITASSKVEFRAPNNEDEVDYCIQFAPGQTFKLDHAKGDDGTELTKK